MDLKLKTIVKEEKEIIEIFSIGDEEGNKVIDVELDLTPSKVAKAELFALKNKNVDLNKNPEVAIEMLSLVVRNYDDVFGLLISRLETEDFVVAVEAIMGKYQNLIEEKS